MKESDFYEWLETQPVEDKIVSIKYKYSHEKEWTQSNEILEVDLSYEDVYVWLNDWDEGQQDIEILGCIPVSDINVPIFDRKTEPQTEREASDKASVDRRYSMDCNHIADDKEEVMNNYLHPIWCPKCAKVGKCYEDSIIPKCYEPQTERAEIMSCQECKWWFTDSLKHGGYCQSFLYNQECRYEPQERSK